MSDVINISGGAGPEEAVAIAAVITHVVIEARAAANKPQQFPRQSTWVESWRPREIHNPLPSHVYDAEPWITGTNPESP